MGSNPVTHLGLLYFVLLFIVEGVMIPFITIIGTPKPKSQSGLAVWSAKLSGVFHEGEEV